MNKNTMRTRLFLSFMLIAILIVVSGCEGVLFPLPYRSLAPFEGRVVDTKTKHPIEGAVVLAVYYYETHSVAGPSLHLKDGQETLTDKNGEFKLPRTRRWFKLHRGYPEGKLVIFKPGYGLFPDHRKSVAVGVNKSWPPSGKPIVFELPRLKTKKERILNLPGAYPYEDIPYKRQKLYMRATNREAVDLGISPYPEPIKEHIK